MLITFFKLKFYSFDGHLLFCQKLYNENIKGVYSSAKAILENNELPKCIVEHILDDGTIYKTTLISI